MNSPLALAGPLLLVGAGKMGGAMLQGWLKLGLDPKSVYVIDPQPAAEMQAELEAHGIALNPFSVPEPNVVVLAVKPQIAKPALEAVSGHVGKGTLFVSILAGITLGAIQAGLPAGTKIVRCMPNTPAAVGRGMTVLIGNAGVGDEERAVASRLLEASGEVAWIDEEALMDAVTAVSGSGPAYVFLLAETLTQAGIEAGLPADLAAQLARATVSGAGELLHRSDLPPETLRQNVTSTGGTTAAALEVLMAADGFASLLEKAVHAATERSRELGRG